MLRVLTFSSPSPVGLKEAALDSPSFRATALHIAEQVDALEKWLDGLAKATTKLSQESSTLDNLVNSFIGSVLPLQTLSEAIVDPDYSLLAAKRFSEAAKDLWAANVAELRRLDTLVADPLRAFLQNEIRNFRECRRQLEQSQKIFDQLQLRFSAQSKTKEPSSLREDAFQLHESRKAYLRSSMDFASSAPQLRIGLDNLLVKIFADQSHAMRTSREGSGVLFARWTAEFDRIRSWSKEMELSEKAFRRELHSARKQIEDAAEQAARPSRELEDYSQSGAGSLTNRGPSTFTALKPNMATGGKQGWLNAKTVAGKPARTSWIRRWFYVKNGVFGWLVQGSRSGGVEESERIGVLLCGLRLASSEERRFCFEVKTKDVTIVLQADSYSDLTEWMAAFDVAKQKALEDPTSTTLPPPGPPAKQPLDLAFAISLPSAQEFAASAADVGLASDDSHDRSVSLSLGIPNDVNVLAHRGSFDVSPGRRSTAIENDSGRDQTGKIMQRFDLRKSTGGPQSGMQSGSLGGAGSSAAPGGIASLISASHMTLPLAPSAMQQSQSSEAGSRPGAISTRTNLSSVLKSLPSSTLAPPTLVNPPNATNLSAVAVMVSSEKGIGIGQSDDTGSTPSGPLANLWGSFNWGYTNRLERELTSNAVPPKGVPAEHVNQSVEQVGKEDLAEGLGAGIGPLHRKTISLDGDVADFQRAVIGPPEFPNYYPTLLKHHDAQFRLLFPNVKKDHRLVLVFRATWNPNDQQEFPGRVFVTSQDVYFYSHYVGLVLTTGLSLSSVSEVTAAPGRECDFIFLHLKQLEKYDYTRITIKTFLEPLRLLQRRLNFLVLNAASEKPQNIEGILKTLIKLEHPEDEGDKSPSIGSWDDPTNAMPKLTNDVSGRDLKTRVRVDQDLQIGHRVSEKESTRFKLPSRPVNYIPLGMTVPVVEKEFNVSPKALFHLLFGDRSAVWQMLYHERHAQNIRQGPWTQQEQSQVRRYLTYQIDSIHTHGQAQVVEVQDVQTIDVNSDHLCYVVTDKKTPWNLPYAKDYTLLSKIVITHIAKSKSKLAIYTKVDWLRRPFLIGSIVERKALADLALGALDVVDVTFEQVRRLGHQNNTKKAIQVFGPIGQEKQIIEFHGSERSMPARVDYTMKQEALPYLIVEQLIISSKNLVASVIVYTVAAVRWSWTTLNANLLIFLLLIFSALFNTLLLSKASFAWLQERRAGMYMQDLGIGQDLIMGKSISVVDLDLAILPDEDQGLGEESKW